MLPSAGQCWPVLVSPHHELSVPGVRAVQLLDIKTVLLRTLQRTNSSGRGHTYEMSTWPVEGGVYVEWKSADNCGVQCPHPRHNANPHHPAQDPVSGGGKHLHQGRRQLSAQLRRLRFSFGYHLPAPAPAQLQLDSVWSCYK